MRPVVQPDAEHLPGLWHRRSQLALVEPRGRHRREVELRGEGPEGVPLVVEAAHFAADLAAGDCGDVDAPIVGPGHHKGRPSTEVGDPHAGTSVESRASQGIEAETQWVIQRSSSTHRLTSPLRATALTLARSRM